MELAFVLFKYFPYGGIQRDMVRIAQECLRKGHRVRIYTIGWQGEVPAVLLADQVRIITLPVRALTNHRKYQKFAARVQAALVAEPADLVIGMNKMPGLDLYFAGDSCFLDKVDNQRGRFYRWLPRFKLFAAFEAAVFGKDSATHIMTISDLQTPLYQHYYDTPDSRLHPLPPGIDRTRQAPANRDQIREEMRVAAGLAEDELLLLFLGSGFIKKGLDRALRAVAALDAQQRARCKLYIVGADSPGKFPALAKTLGIADQIQFFQGRDDVPRLLFGSDILLLPAYDENTGTVILEAIIAGLPVLVTENCGYAHYVQDADAGLVIPDPFVQSAMNALLARMVADAQARNDWSRHGVAFGRQADVYRLHAYAADLIELVARSKREPEFDLGAAIAELDRQGSATAAGESC